MMTLKEIRESGLLELYVIGETSPEDNKVVEAALVAHPALKYDMAEIEATLKVYSDLHAIKPSDQVLQDILAKTKATAATPSSTTAALDTSAVIRPFKLAAIAASLLLLGATFMWFQQKNINAELADSIVICEEEQKEKDKELDLFNQINNPQNIVVQLNSTEKYPEAIMYLHTNIESQRNFIQMMNLPEISDSQSYQLWSLKDGLAPIPLDVFENQNGTFLEVGYENETKTYAITVEPKGGRTEPTLENLVGTFSI